MIWRCNWVLCLVSVACPNNHDKSKTLQTLFIMWIIDNHLFIVRRTRLYTISFPVQVCTTVSLTKYLNISFKYGSKRYQLNSNRRPEYIHTVNHCDTIFPRFQSPPKTFSELFCHCTHLYLHIHPSRCSSKLVSIWQLCTVNQPFESIRGPVMSHITHLSLMDNGGAPGVYVFTWLEGVSVGGTPTDMALF